VESERNRETVSGMGGGGGARGRDIEKNVERVVGRAVEGVWGAERDSERASNSSGAHLPPPP
jgi:hypothetical protein